VKKRIAHLMLTVLLTASAVALAGCGVIERVFPSGEIQQVEIKALVKVDYPGFSKALSKGQTVKLRNEDVTLGELTAVAETPTMVAVPTWNGSIVMTASPNLRDINMTIVGPARLTDTGYTFDGSYLYVNQMAKILAPYAQFEALIVSIRKVGG
jgi:hypothetical protein